MLLSIIVPVYNVEKYLCRCVDSLLDQGDFNDYEIILVDDGSTDKSGQLCDAYAEKYTNIVSLHQNNSGAATSRNSGLRTARGKFVFFVDSDDYIKSNCLNKLFDYIQTYELDVLCFNYLYSYVDGKKEVNTVITPDSHPITGADFLLQNLRNNTMQMMPVKSIYLTDLLLDNEVYFRDGYRYEDEHWVPRALINAKRIMQCTEVIYAYCIRETSVSRNQESKEKGAKDLISNCISLNGFVQQISTGELKHLLENNICTLVLSAVYNGKLTDNCREISLFIKKLNTDKKNSIKKAIFCINPKLYYFINLCIKKIYVLIFFFHEVLLTADKVFQYSNQQFHKYIRKIRITNKQKKQLRNHSFSIISSNCNGAVITSELGEQFRTPTVNLFFAPSDFVKFASNIEHYFSCELIEVKNSMESFPVGKLDDITIYFMHYKSFEEARNKWNIRKQRVNFHNIFFMLSKHNGCTECDINNFLKLPFENKIVFTNDNADQGKNFVYVEEDKNEKEVGIMTDFVKPLGARKYDKYFDYVKWLNEGERT